MLLPAFTPSGFLSSWDFKVGSLTLPRPGTVARMVKNTGDFDVTIRINRYGLRDAKDIREAAPGRLIVVGDSFAWDFEPADRFSDRNDALAPERAT